VTDEDVPVVTWRRLVDAASDASVLSPHPTTNAGFSESVEIVFAGPADPEWEFRVDDEPLPRGSGGWTWKPRFYAGLVAADLVLRDHVVCTYAMQVDPDARKLGTEEFRAMLDELWAEDPELVVGAEPATMQCGALGESEDPVVALARLRRYVPELLRAVAALRVRPRTTLRSVRAASQWHHVRTVDRQTAMAAARSTAVALLAADQIEGLDFDRSARLDVPVVEDTVDCAANRAMLYLLRSVHRRTLDVRQKLEERVAAEDPSETRTGLAARWPVRKQLLERFDQQLQLLLRQSPFPSVTRAEVSAAGLNAVSADPLYSRAWGRGWRALRRGIESESDDRLWLRPSWEIYEGWTFVALRKLLQQALQSWQWRRHSRDLWGAKYGDRTLVLELQAKFPSRDEPTASRRSVSRQRIPDVLIHLSDAQRDRFVALDAKYRVTRENVLDAMASAHIYQDSLRIGEARPAASVLLVPAGGGAPWLESEAFQSEHRVGVHVMNPGRRNQLPLAVEAMLRSTGHP
jgi:PD-(D/E)XK nuclease superfamily